jgi:hypothetical protein
VIEKPRSDEEREEGENVDGIDGSPQVGIAEIPKGLEMGLMPPVEEISVVDEDDIRFCEPISRIKVLLPLNEIKRFMSIKYLQDSFDFGHSRSCSGVRIKSR